MRVISRVHIVKFFTGNTSSMWHLCEDWQRLHARLQHNILLWIGSLRLDEDNHTNTDTHRQVGLLFATTRRATIRQDASASDVGWTFTRMLTPVLMKLNGSPLLRLYNEKSAIIRPYYSLTHCSRSTSLTMYCIVYKLNVSMRALRPTTIAKICLRTDCCNAFLPQFLKYGSESSWDIRSSGAKVPRVRKFRGAKVLGLFAPRERMFQWTKVPRELSFYLWTFHSREWKCGGTKSPDALYIICRPWAIS